MDCFVNSRIFSLGCSRVTYFGCHKGFIQVSPCLRVRTHRQACVCIRSCRNSSSSQYSFNRRDLIKGLLTVSIAPFLSAFPATATHNFKLTGQYEQDVRNMVESLRMACDLQRDTPEHDSTVQRIRKQMSDFVSFYRRNPNVAGSPSFSTIYTAINTVAGHYTTFGTEYPIPEKRKARLEQQFKDIERAVSRGR
ncbi:Photosystem II lipoprotein Psb27 [Galdieria sulphuraria]|uniref:Photosystem II Psb27 protein n=1 Tax=Galdieria sulphuraria TaxID=130081 RepID=M2XG22_GALSU|nr:photosystem II Psb27 protein [Galdieria sulphuraria]EME28982.1 photosystem II Psb27 protein [Galdieria sulphuraria]GJD06919.1 Photosystem II lipoprotein Psb27 [Galdieria sulphuraria]|eukprot:XP_005705502.1 photosystem II Psb27 protein [Galdieria sulphuraria]